MPNYDYQCPRCGLQVDLRRGLDEGTIVCPNCNEESATRVAVNLHQGIVLRGGPNAPMPDRDNPVAVQEEMARELKGKGWTAERATQEIRDNITTDEKGNKSLNTKGMTQKTS